MGSTWVLSFCIGHVASQTRPHKNKVKKGWGLGTRLGRVCVNVGPCPVTFRRESLHVSTCDLVEIGGLVAAGTQPIPVSSRKLDS